MLKKIFKLAKKLSKEKEKSSFSVEKLKIWGVLSGPYSREEVEDPYVPKGLNFMLVCKVSYRDKVFDREFWFEDLKGANTVIDHFKISIEPMEMKV